MESSCARTIDKESLAMMRAAGDSRGAFIRRRPAVAPDRTDVTTWADLLDLEEDRDVPRATGYRTALSDSTYRVVVEYDGTDFCGFQYQATERTIAGELETALSRLFDRPVKVSSAGRTDAGVHACAQVVSFVSHDAFPVQKLAIALNSALPYDITARDAARVERTFSARNSALERHYCYSVLNRRMPSAVLRRFAHHDWRTLDLDRMRAGAAHLVGQHDFVTFCGVLPDRGGTVRTLLAIDIQAENELVRLHFRAAGFLHRMVRVMTGTLLDVGAGRRTPECVAAMLAARDRRAAGPTAPPQGLCLVNVVYPGFESRSPNSPDSALATTSAACGEADAMDSRSKSPHGF